VTDSGGALPLEVEPQDVKRALDDDQSDCVLIDCRERDEHELVHIGAATLLPMSEIENRRSELEPHLERRVIVHCHHGGRSLRVAQWLRQQGFAKAQSMAGGIDRWAERIDPSLPRY